MASAKATILDTCVLLNLAASDELADIVSTIRGATFICSAVTKEALDLRDEAEPAVLVPLDLADVVRVGGIQLCDVAIGAEEESYVSLAAELDDGEAMSIAIAASRGMDFASDDQKARRIFGERVPDSRRLTSTSAIVKQWAHVRAIAPQQLRAVLRRIMVRARFKPSTKDPNAAWWDGAAV